MAKEPGERYATAKALSEDLGNYLMGKPIKARRVGLPERAWRLCRRNPAAAGLVGVSVLAAMAVVGIVVSQLDRAQIDSARKSVTASLAKEVSARNSEATIRYFNNMLMAGGEWTDCNVGRAERLLDECISKTGEVDLRGWEWHYLKRQCHTEVRTLAGHGINLGTIVFSTNGLVATVDTAFRYISIWNAKTGERVRTIEIGPDRGQNYGDIAFSPDGSLIAASHGMFTEPGEVKIWEVSSGREVCVFPKVTGGDSSVTFSPDGARLAVGGGGMKGGTMLTVWDVKTRVNLLTIRAPLELMGWISVAFSPDGERIALADGKLDEANVVDKPGDVTILDSWSGAEVLPSLKGHSHPLTSVAYSPDGKLLVTTGYDKMVRVWDAITGKEKREFRVSSQRPNKVVFSPDSKRVATASEDNSARIWDVTSGQELLTLRGHTREVLSVAYSSDGKMIATAGGDQHVKIWDAETGKESLTLRGHSQWVNGVAFSHNGNQVVTACIDGKVRVFDVDDGRIRQTFDDQFGSVWGVAFSPDDTLIASGSGEWKWIEKRGQILIREAATGRVMHTLRAHAGLARTVAFSPDGKQLASVGGEHWFEPGVVKVWDVATGSELQSFAGHTLGLAALEYSPDGRTLASGGWDATVRLWDANAGGIRQTFPGDSFMTWILAFDPEGKHIASAGETSGAKIWELATGKVREFEGHKGSVRCLAYSPDGTRVASGGVDMMVKVWDPRTCREAFTLRGHTGPVWSVAFSPDGHRIASASEDGTVKIWDGTPWVEPTSRPLQNSKANESR